ncbi:MAG: hypothetical protein AAFR55_02710, partial [Pseudomonadota bacterium]
MFAALFRIIFGLIVACAIGGATQVLFALTPAELAVAGPERWQFALEWFIQSAAVIMLVAAPIVFLIGIFAEIAGIRSFAFYLLAGLFVALAGFAVIYSGEEPNGPTLANSYGIATFLTTGFVAGLSYWLVSGRFAGRRRRRDAAFSDNTVEQSSARRAEGSDGGGTSGAKAAERSSANPSVAPSATA